MPPAPLEQRKRRSARFALYSSLVILTGLMLLAVGAIERTMRHTGGWAEQRLVELPEVEQLRDYIRIPTTGGREVEGAEFLAAQLAAAGIDATIERLGDGRANLWAVLEGEDPNALVLHHHIDVWDPGDLDEWLFPPFEAAVDGPWLHGRGSFDMKSYGIAQLRAFLNAAALDRPLKRSLILLATSDEENGSVLGTRWVLSQHPELVDRFWAVLTEGGVIEALNPDAIKYSGIETAQMNAVQVKVCDPRRERLEILAADLDSRLGRETPIQLTPELEGFLHSYAPTRSQRRLRNHLGRPELMLRHRHGFDILPPFVRLLFRNRTSAGEIVADPGGGFSMVVTLLLLPGMDLTQAVEELLPSWMTHGLEVAIGQPQGAAVSSPTDHPLFRAAADSLSSAYPQAAASEIFLPWTLTDSRFFRDHGIPSYGYSPFLFFSTDTVRVDRVNERIPLPGFISGVDIYSRLVETVVAGPQVDNLQEAH